MGWYATVIAAVLVGWSGIPAAPNRDCSAIFSCLTPREEIVLILIFTAPIVGVLLCCTVVVTGLLVRRFSSSILTGTLSALGSVGVLAVVGAVWQGLR